MKFAFLFFIFYFSLLHISAQTKKHKEKENYPDWISLMHDSVATYADVQKSYVQYFSDHKMPVQQTLPQNVNGKTPAKDALKQMLRDNFMCLQMKKYKRYMELEIPGFDKNKNRTNIAKRRSLWQNDPVLSTKDGGNWLDYYKYKKQFDSFVYNNGFPPEFKPDPVIIVTPNPCHNEFSVKCHDAEFPLCDISCINSKGIQLLDKIINIQNTILDAKINITNFPLGKYTVKTCMPDGYCKIDTLVKQ